MGSFTYDDPCDRPYGPTNPDYEMDAKRAASGSSPEILSMQDALMEGQRAGSAGNSAGLNPYQSSTPEYAEWERGRHAAEAIRLSRGRKIA